MRLLRDIVESVINSETNSRPESPSDAQDDGENARTRCRRYRMSRRQHLTLTSNPMLVLAAMEGLTRENYAAALIAEALDGDNKIEQDKHERLPGSGKVGELEAGSWKKEVDLGAVELDDAMQALLSHSAADLRVRLWGKESSSPSPETEGGLRRREDTRVAGVCSSDTRTSGCPHVRVLRALQVHIIAYCGDSGRHTPTCTVAARELVVALAVRLLRASLEVFTTLLELETPGDGDSWECNRHRACIDQTQEETVRQSFLALVPLLCTSIVALPVNKGGRVSLATALLPSVYPLVGTVDRVNRLQRTKYVGSTSHQNGTTFVYWISGFEEALAMLSADLVCSLTEEEAVTPRRLVDPTSRTVGDRGVRDRNGAHENSHTNEAEQTSQDVIELLLKLSPFLQHGRPCFDQQGVGPFPNNPDFADAFKVTTVRYVLNESLPDSFLAYVDIRISPLSWVVIQLRLAA